MAVVFYYGLIRLEIIRKEEIKRRADVIWHLHILSFLTCVVTHFLTWTLDPTYADPYILQNKLL